MHVEKGKLFVPTEKKMFDKFTMLCELSAKRKEIGKTFQNGFINITQLKEIPKDIDKFRIGNGYFFEFFVDFLEIFEYMRISTSVTILDYTLPLRTRISSILPDSCFSENVDLF